MEAGIVKHICCLCSSFINPFISFSKLYILLFSICPPTKLSYSNMRIYWVSKIMYMKLRILEWYVNGYLLFSIYMLCEYIGFQKLCT